MSRIFVFMLVVCVLHVGKAQERPQYSSSTFCLPVSDLVQATAWYQQLLGNVEHFSPAPGVVEFKLNDNTWLQLFEGTIGNGSIFRLEVADIQKQHSKLDKLGISPTAIELVPKVVSYFDFTDPDGNQLSFYKLEPQ